MLIEHRGKTPTVHESVFVAPNAILCGDVTIGANSQVLFGTVITAAGGAVTIGENCVIMENVVMRGTPGRPLTPDESIMPTAMPRYTASLRKHHVNDKAVEKK